jgi:hypothetical protein
MEGTSPETGGTADVVVIGFSVGLPRLATLSAALFEVARSSVADGISYLFDVPARGVISLQRKWLADPSSDGIV